MNLEAARRVKERLRAAQGGSRVPAGAPSFATGIRLADGAGEYAVSVLLTSDDDRRLLAFPPVKRVLQATGSGVEVEVIGDVLASGSDEAEATVAQPARLLTIGASVGHRAGGVGSLGFFAKRRSDGKRGFVSCNHVIAMVDRGSDGDAVVSPSMLDGGAEERDVVAALDGHYPRLGGTGRQFADCAFAALRDCVPYDAALLPGGALSAAPADVACGLMVTKVGRLTGVRPGVIQRIEVDDLRIRYGRIVVSFGDVIQIGSASALRFCEHGDSGALVHTIETRQPVGLLFAASRIGGPHDAGWAWVNRIGHVTAALGVELVTRVVDVDS